MSTDLKSCAIRLNSAFSDNGGGRDDATHASCDMMTKMRELALW